MRTYSPACSDKQASRAEITSDSPELSMGLQLCQDLVLKRRLLACSVPILYPAASRERTSWIASGFKLVLVAVLLLL